jgi:spermidine synthase
MGLGVASKLILGNILVDSLTTVEIDPDVITIYNQMHPILPKAHKIVNMSGMDFLVQTEEKFDFIFLDFYDVIDEETLIDIADHVEVGKSKLNKGGEIVGWFDPYTPEEFVDEFFKLFTDWSITI